MIIIFITIFAIFVASAIIYLSEKNKVKNVDNSKVKTISQQPKTNQLVTREYKTLEVKKTPDVHEIIVRNNEYVPKINSKYLHTDYPSYKFYLDNRYDYCKRYSSEKEAIEAIKQYYEYKDINPIVHETDLKNCDIVHYPICDNYYPRVNKQYINSASFTLYKIYRFENKPSYSKSFNTKKEALRFLETYNNSLGLNDVVIKVDLNL